VLATASGVHCFEGTRLETRSTHGTGCTLASALAISLAQGLDLVAAIQRARAYVLAAIASAPGLGSGHGPLNHAAGTDPA
jgi:hydroxymethylpyrimidine/phosphomethylpyrimidine kinase